MRRAITLAALWVSACNAGAGSDAGLTDAGAEVDAGTSLDASAADTAVADSGELPPIAVPAESQRAGDPAAGLHALLNDGYVGCGIPYSAYSAVIGPAPPNLRLPGREGHNAELPYSYSAFTTTSSVEVVSPNCLSCHGSVLGGQIVIGLGDTDADFTVDPSQTAEAVGFLIPATSTAARAEWRKWADRIAAVAPYIQTEVVGLNPADNLAAALFARHDAATLAWSPTLLLDPPPTQVIPVDVPPWWRMRKKNAMFYTASGRGDHARIEMTASTLCIDSVAEAARIDRYFNDVRAYIASLVPPPYPYPVDAVKAAAGKAVFESSCSRCHGTYGAGESYPNLVIPYASVGTDPLMAAGQQPYATRFVSWFNSSFYGRTARLEPEAGYIAPPLDGIWATSPYLHNGSVPTLAALLDSTARPTYWTRPHPATDFDADAVGVRFSVVDHGRDAEPNPSMKKTLYDTTRLGYSNAGHTYGDTLSADDRGALLEYLKTL